MQGLNSHLEQFLLEILLIELPELPETQLAEVREEDPPLLLHLALHVHHLLLCGGQTEGLHGRQQVLTNSGRPLQRDIRLLVTVWNITLIAIF